jgi:hypothetical protein
MPSGEELCKITPASTRRLSGTVSATRAAPIPHSPPIPRLASARNAMSCQILVAAAHNAVPAGYITIVANRARLRPIRSASQPNNTPPAAQPTSRIEVIVPVQKTVASWAPGAPGCSPSSTGTQLGATKLNRRASKTSNPQPARRPQSPASDSPKTPETQRVRQRFAKPRAPLLLRRRSPARRRSRVALAVHPCNACVAPSCAGVRLLLARRIPCPC